MSLLNYTSSVEPELTISEIQRMLSKHGVLAMMTEYDGPQVSAVSFKMNVEGRVMGFKMPCNWRGVREVIKNDKRAINRVGHRNLDTQSVRTAWRIIKDWVEAQLALVDVNMVTIPQVFLPYAIMPNGQTLSEHITNNPSLLLGGGEQ